MAKNSVRNKRTPASRADHLGPWKWKPGQCGNPFGRPVKTPITDRYLKAIETRLPDEIRCKLGLPKGATVGDAIARKVAIKALNGSIDAAREIADRVEGKPAQAVKVEGSLVEAPTFVIQFDGGNSNGNQKRHSTEETKNALQGQTD